MTKLLIVALIILLFIIGIRIYANHRMEYLYDELMCQAFRSDRVTYARTFAELLRFRKRFYLFLNYYTRVERFNLRYRSFKSEFPEACETLENLYLN